MWRRVASFSPLVSSSKSTLLNQGAARLKSWRVFTTEVSTPVKSGTSVQEKTPFITFVLGGPGSGKGTQCVKIAKTFGFAHVSVQDLLKDLILANSEEGIRRSIIDGKFQLSEMTVKLVQKEMESPDKNRFLIEDFPRSEENRIAFESTMGAEPNVVLYFDCPEEEMIERAFNQHKDQEDRFDDDIEDTIRKRLEVFETRALPVIDYYSKKGKLHRIDAVGTVDEVFERVCPVFAECEEAN